MVISCPRTRIERPSSGTVARGGASRSAGCHLSPRPQLTRLSALGLHSAPCTDSCLNTHTCSHTHTSHMYSMVRNDIAAYTHKHAQAAATWPKSRTGRHQRSFLGINCMSSCPQITHIYTNTLDRIQQKRKNTESSQIKALFFFIKKQNCTFRSWHQPPNVDALHLIKHNQEAALAGS